MATVRIHVQCIFLYNSSTTGCVILRQILDDKATVRREHFAFICLQFIDFVHDLCNQSVNASDIQRRLHALA